MCSPCPDVPGLADCLAPREGYQLTQACGDLIPSDMTNAETSRYSHLLLEWVRHWDSQAWDRIKLDSAFSRKG